MKMWCQFSPKVIQLQKQQELIEGKLTLLDQLFGQQLEGQVCSKTEWLVKILPRDRVPMSNLPNLKAY